MNVEGYKVDLRKLSSIGWIVGKLRYIYLYLNLFRYSFFIYLFLFIMRIVFEKVWENLKNKKW